jgi:pyruvate/2-oxoglutarate dehydrogenase complex dihydrolipoamide acyltransferase (E2) component
MPKVTMPQLGESVAEGTIGRWLKKPGDKVAKYEPIVEVITDKVNAEVPSPFEGSLTEILVQEGETVPNNAEIAVIEGADAEAAEASAPSADKSAASGTSQAESTPSAASRAESATPPAPSPAVTPEPAGASVTGPNVEAAEGQRERPETAPQRAPGGGDGRGGNGSAGPERTVLGVGTYGPAGSDERRTQEIARATATTTREGEYSGPVTPAVKRLAREHGVDLALIQGSGHGGRVTREDVMAFVEAQRTGAAPAARVPTAAMGAPSTTGAPAAAPAAQMPPQSAAAAPPAAARPRADELKPVTPMRKAIAEHMTKAKQTAPHAYTTVEVDMAGVVALRDATKQTYQAREGIALSFVAIVAKAIVEALARHPDLNAHWTEQGLMRKRAINLGIAVAVDDGLIVPVIRDADQLSIHGLNLKVQDFASRARSNKLKLDDIQGGTFTLNNTGWFGSVASQPIINVPEVAILSMEAIVKRVRVVETTNGDTIAIRPMMNVCVSFDHRATDGAQVGRFVQDVRRWLESVDPQTPIW